MLNRICSKYASAVTRDVPGNASDMLAGTLHVLAFVNTSLVSEACAQYAEMASVLPGDSGFVFTEIEHDTC